MSSLLAQPQLLLRPMLKDDLTDIMLIETAAYAYPWNQAIFEDCFKNNYYNYILENEHIILGYILMLIAYRDEAHILNICVHPDHQDCGYGRILLAHVVEIARDKGVQDILLEVRPSNLKARRLYHNAGFNQIGIRRNYYPAANGREHALIFGLSL
jgi:[ribosomal protein S18]-alanine N-acetyltransferase